MAWFKIIQIKDIPKMGSRKILIKDTEIAIFKTNDGSIFAVNNICPHKGGKLTEGLVHEHIITCPLHNTDINLESGESIGEDYKCTNTYETKIENDNLYLNWEK